MSTDLPKSNFLSRPVIGKMFDGHTILFKNQIELSLGKEQIPGLQNEAWDHLRLYRAFVFKIVIGFR